MTAKPVTHRPHWLKLPRGGKVYGVGPTRRDGPLVEFGVDGSGAWIADEGSGLKQLSAEAGVRLLFDMEAFYPAGLTIHGLSKLTALKKAGQTVLRPPARREVW